MEGKAGEIIISDMTEQDIPDAVEIERISCAAPWSEELFLNELRNPLSVARAARLGRLLIGYLCANLVVDEGHIHNLAVHPQFRRLGVASALIEDAIGMLRDGGARFIYLEVRDSNEAARRLYGRFGFEVIGARKDYYQSPVEHAAIMLLKPRP